MASEAEVDLIINTANTLPELERDLDRIINVAEDTAPELQIEAALNQQETLTRLLDDVTEAVSQLNTIAPEVEVQAALDTVESIARMIDDLDDVVDAAEARAREIELDAELDADLAELDAEIAALVAELEASAPEIDLEVDVDRNGAGRRAVTGLGRAFAGAAAPILKTTGALFAAGTATVQLLPLVGGLVSELSNIAPVAAVATTGITAVLLATQTLKVGLIGVQDAVSAAFDPGTKPEELAKALENLAPNARAFVLELRGMRTGLREVQQAIQNQLFEGMTFNLRTLAESVLPELSAAGQRTALTLNRMARGAADAAVRLGRNGTLGIALQGATQGLSNLTELPSQAVTAFGQLAAAASPAFNRITAAVARAGNAISEKLTAAFEDGRLETAINQAVDSLVQLGRVVGNVFDGIGNIMGALQQDGRGLFTVLEQVTQAFAEVTATEGFQSALRALSQTASVVAQTVLPLISRALQLLGPIFEELAPPVQTLVRLIGDQLGKILETLGPILVTAAEAFGKLVTAASPLLVLAGDLITAVLPALNPLLEGLGEIFEAMTPFVQQLADNIGAQLLPLLTNLASTVLPQLIPPFVELATKIFPILTEVLVQLGPSLTDLGLKLAQVAIALAPLIVKLIELTIKLGEDLAPILKPLLGLIVDLVEFGLKVLTNQLSTIVIPAIQVLIDLLSGDFSAAWNGALRIVENVANQIRDKIREMKQGVEDRLRELVQSAQNRLREMVDAFARGFEDAKNRARAKAAEIPGIIVNALGRLANLLHPAGSEIVQGLINGMSERLGRLRQIASEIASVVSGTVKSALGISSPSRVMREVGHDTMDGLDLGLTDRVPDLRSTLQGIGGMVPQFAMPDGRRLTLPQFGQQTPAVQVFIGNEALDGHVDTRIARNNQARDLIAARGVRR